MYWIETIARACCKLNCISHLLNLIPFEDLTPEPIILPPRQNEQGYIRPPITDQTFVPQVYVPVDPKVDSKD